MFDKLIQDFKLTFQRQLAHVLPTIRGGGAEEQVLIDVLLKNEQSPFSLYQLEHWLDRKEREMTALRAYMKDFADFKVIPSKQKLYEMRVNLSIEHLVCYSFSSVGHEDKYLEDLSGYLRSETQESNMEKEDWFDNDDTLVKMRHTTKQFKEFAEANKETKGTFFAVMGLDDGDTETRGKGGSIFHYSHGKLKTKWFDPPMAPGTPTPIYNSPDTISLTWAEPQRGLTHVQHYRVRYRKKSATHSVWVELKTEGRVNHVIVPNLNPEATYEFSVAAVCEVGVGEKSDVIEVSKFVQRPTHTTRFAVARPREWYCDVTIRASCSVMQLTGGSSRENLTSRIFMTGSEPRVSELSDLQLSVIISLHKYISS